MKICLEAEEEIMERDKEEEEGMEQDTVQDGAQEEDFQVQTVIIIPIGLEDGGRCQNMREQVLLHHQQELDGILTENQKHRKQ